jgi:hypothetical protein
MTSTIVAMPTSSSSSSSSSSSLVVKPSRPVTATTSKKRRNKDSAGGGDGDGGGAKKKRKKIKIEKIMPVNDLQQQQQQQQHQQQRQHQKQAQQPLQSLRSNVTRYVGRSYQVGKTTFISPRGLYATIFDDYTILTDFDYAPFSNNAPKSLKETLKNRWVYAMHVSHGMVPSVNRNLLHARVIGGEILAYKCTECSIEGNECLYYGIIPTNNIDIEHTHKICRFGMQAVFPRKLYIYLEMVAMCTCKRRGCYRLRAISFTNNGENIHFCANDVPWSKIYVMMGDLENNDDVKEGYKVPRECVVCAQCYDCSKSVQYCRRHYKCRHKNAITIEEVEHHNPLTASKIKNCKKI